MIRTVWLACAEWSPYSRVVLNVSLVAGVFGILREGSVGGFYTATAQLPLGWQQVYDVRSSFGEAWETP